MQEDEKREEARAVKLVFSRVDTGWLSQLLQSYIDDEEFNFTLIEDGDYGSDMWSRGYLFAMRRILRDMKAKETPNNA